MRRFWLPAAWLLSAALVLMFGPGCAGTLPPIDTDQVNLGICLATCKNGNCQKADGAWQCVVPDPCAGKSPICERNDDTDCWAQTPNGKCTFFPKPADPPPAAVCPACPAGQSCTDPKVGCVPTPPTPPTPPPTQPGCPVGEPELEAVPDPASGYQFKGVVTQAISEMGDTTGVNPRTTLDALAAKVRRPGRCVISGIEAIFVQRADGLWEEYHAVFFGTGALIPGGKPMGFHRGGSAPPVTDACPADPCPDRVWTRETLPPGWGEDAIGKPRWHWNAKEHTMGNADSTPVNDRNCGFCNVVMNDPARCSCPVRPDGHPDRVAVENWLLEGGAVRDSRNGQDCTPNNTDNPFAFLFGTGNCRICNTPKTVCSDWM